MRVMTKLVGGAVALAALAAVALAQSGSPSGLAKRAASGGKPDTGPVTLAEMHTAIDRLDTALRRVVFAGSAPAAKHGALSDKPATRSEAVKEFDRLFELGKPHFKFTPRKVAFDPKLLSIPASDPSRKMLERLIAWGFVGRVSPFATSPKPTMTIPEFGDAIGFFLLRMTDLTHTPSSDWSPYMFGHKGGG